MGEWYWGASRALESVAGDTYSGTLVPISRAARQSGIPVHELEAAPSVTEGSHRHERLGVLGIVHLQGEGDRAETHQGSAPTLPCTTKLWDFYAATFDEAGQSPLGSGHRRRVRLRHPLRALAESQFDGKFWQKVGRRRRQDRHGLMVVSPLCRKCGRLLDRMLVDSGEDYHPSCKPTDPNEVLGIELLSGLPT